MASNQEPGGWRRLWGEYRPALALATLCAALVTTFLAQASLRKARLELGAAQQRLAQATAKDKESQDRVALAAFASEFLRQAARQQLQPERWADQAIAVSQARIGRPEAVSLLLQAQNHAGHVFGAQEFDISSASLKAGLFVDTAARGEELVVTLRGRTTFRTQ